MLTALDGACGEPPANQLTAAEQSQGWQLLFDGQTTRGWRGFRKTQFPEKGWTVEGGWLKHRARGGGGDLMTEGVYADFELAFEWRTGSNANSGVKYFVREQGDGAVGHEYQLLDDSTGRPAVRSRHETASFYDVLAPDLDVPPLPPGQTNQSRIVVQNQRIEHWLNGRKALEYEPGSAKVRAAVAASKFRHVEGFGAKLPGPLLLQDHGGEVWFRNVKVRVFPPPAASGGMAAPRP